MFKEGQIVLAQGHGITTFKVTRLLNDGQFATIQAFSISKQELLGSLVVNVPTGTLISFKNDSRQGAEPEKKKR